MESNLTNVRLMFATGAAATGGESNAIDVPKTSQGATPILVRRPVRMQPLLSGRESCVGHY
jgi:hypothetical protein